MFFTLELHFVHHLRVLLVPATTVAVQPTQRNVYANSYRSIRNFLDEHLEAVNLCTIVFHQDKQNKFTNLMGGCDNGMSSLLTTMFSHLCAPTTYAKQYK
jgi:hypothetical protein